MARELFSGGADSAARGAGGALAACWLPMTHPTSNPKRVPAIANAIESDFMGVRSGSYRAEDGLVLADNGVQPLEEGPGDERMPD